MGKPTGRRRSQENVAAPKPAENKGGKPTKAADRATAVDEDTAMFISMSHDLKEEGNKLFQKRDHEGAMLKYEKALKLLPKTHIDVAYLRVNMAACYMEMGLGEYPRAINEYNLALEVSPKYSKAMLKRAKCYEALNKLDFAFQDVHNVLSMEPNNSSALEVLESVKKAMIEKGIDVEQKMKEFGLVNKVETRGISLMRQVVKEKLKRKKKSGKSDEKHVDDKAVVVEKASDVEGKVSNAKGKASEVEEKMSDVKDKEVVTKIVEEQIEVTKGISQEEKLVTKTVKLVFGEDIRWAQLPVNCSIRLVRDIVRDRFPSLNGVLMKYKDPEGDLVTITTTDELRLAELLSNSQGSLRLFIAEVSSDQEPAYEGMDGEKEVHKGHKEPSNIFDIGKEENDVEVAQRPTCIEEWIVQFARLFKNHVGLDTDSYLDLHELGMKLYSEAMEDAVTSEEAQELFEIAADKFQEMAALALFNWGNIHMSRARKRIFFPEDGSQESVLAQVKSGYEWAKKEYTKAGMKYEEAMKIKPDFYEGLLASGQQKFEEAKLCWCHAIGSELDEGSFEGGLSKEVLELYDKSEDSMERGMQMWEEMEEKRLNGLSKFDEYKSQLQKMGLDGLFKDMSPEEAAEQAANMRSQINLLWGTMLYERSVVEYRLELPTWEECLEVSVEKFELAGASPTDIAVMIKSHCSNQSALEGFGFKIDEIVQAWNEMYDAKRWQIGVPSFRLEPLFRRRSPKLHDMLENI